MLTESIADMHHRHLHEIGDRSRVFVRVSVAKQDSVDNPLEGSLGSEMFRASP